MAARLQIEDGAYSLYLDEGEDGQWRRLASLPAGARALLPAARAVDAGALEQAIEIAEDWLMPHAARLQGRMLEVEDGTGRLRSGLREVLSVEAVEWSVADVEAAFLRLVDLATGRVPAAVVQERPLFVADVLLLRELAHHGRVRGLRLPEA